MPNGPAERTVLAWAIGNVMLSVSLVGVNKIVMNDYRFKYIITLSSFHFIATLAFLEVITRVGIFGATKKLMPTADNFRVAAAGAMSVVLMNLSLHMNSIGFYQVTKLSVIPMVMVIEFVRDGKSQTYRVCIALFILLLGVGIATVTDVKVSMEGIAVASMAVVATAQSQIWVGSKQKEHGLTAVQGAHSVAAPMAGLTIVGALLFENDVFSHLADAQFKDMALIFMSCMLAMMLNVTTFGLIGITSATTFQVVGHAKTCLIILSGLLLYPIDAMDIVAMNNLFGTMIAIVGMILYGHIKVVDNKRSSGEQVQDCLDSWLPGDLFKHKQSWERRIDEEIAVLRSPQSEHS